ncbi:MAG: LytTR family transcriptional regulator [Clostridia bacterium]|nr:LytTR family transcriptional regulator [Clostridia bacterium]
MKFKLIIDKNAEECITAVCHERTPIIDQIESIIQKESNNNGIVGYADDEFKTIEFESIEVIYVEGGKTFAVLDDKRTYRVKLRLYEVESLLPPNFKKLSKSVIGNMKKIDRFSSTITGAVDAVFKCGRKEFVSRRCLAEIKRGLKK